MRILVKILDKILSIPIPAFHSRLVKKNKCPNCDSQNVKIKYRLNIAKNYIVYEKYGKCIWDFCGKSSSYGCIGIYLYKR